MSQSPQYNESRQNQSISSQWNVFTRKLSKNCYYLKILVPYLDNSSEERTAESRRKMKLKKLPQQKHLIKPWK